MEKLNVLVMDDEPEVREYLKNILERRGYVVFTAQDGEEGLEKIKQANIDIVLADIVMPKMDGIEFLRHVRDYDLKVEVIMITGHSTLDRCVDVIENNACGYLTKPLKAGDILLRIAKAKRNICEKKEMLVRALEETRHK